MFLKVTDSSVTVNSTIHSFKFGSIEYKPNFELNIPIQYMYKGTRYPCSLNIGTDGSVRVNGVMEPSTNESVQVSAFVCFPDAI